jgi:hypothetical protein
MSPKKFFRFLRHAPTFLGELSELKRQARQSHHDFPITRINPYPHEKKQQIGTAKGHYFHQDLLVAQRIFESAPEKHVDVGSRPSVNRNFGLSGGYFMPDSSQERFQL